MTLLTRRVVIIATALILVGGMLGYRFLKSQKTQPPRRPPVEARLPEMRARILTPQTLAVPVPMQGRIRALEIADLFAEVNGIFQRGEQPFRPGVRFAQGQVMVRLDDREARLALQSQRAGFLSALVQLLPDIKSDFPDRFEVWRAYIDQLDPEADLPILPAPASEREKLFLAARQIQSQYYTIRSVEERLGKYTLHAPFDGILTEVDVSPGTLVRPGQRLGQLLREGAFELESTLSLVDMPFIRTGQEVLLRSDDTGDTYRGVIRRIGQQIDPATQMVPVFISLSGPSLREGMFLQGYVQGMQASNVYPLPKELLINGKYIWIIRDSMLMQHTVELVRAGRDRAIIRDFPAGLPYLSELTPGIYEGMKIKWSIE
jgi:membrane fusion protein (multidrug efflux system)